MLVSGSKRLRSKRKRAYSTWKSNTIWEPECKARWYILDQSSPVTCSL